MRRSVQVLVMITIRRLRRVAQMPALSVVMLPTDGLIKTQLYQPR